MNARFDAELWVNGAVGWLRLALEATGAVIVAVGFVVAVGLLLRSVAARESDGFSRARITLARYLALALEFQLGADILSTTVAPSWDALGKLAVVAIVRTALNYFLTLEMREESRNAPTP